MPPARDAYALGHLIMCLSESYTLSKSPIKTNSAPSPYPWQDLRQFGIRMRDHSPKKRPRVDQVLDGIFFKNNIVVKVSQFSDGMRAWEPQVKYEFFRCVLQYFPFNLIISVFFYSFLDSDFMVTTFFVLFNISILGIYQYQFVHFLKLSSFDIFSLYY